MKRLKLTLSTVLILLFFGESGFAQDLPNLNYYKVANQKIGLPAADENSVVFMGNSITQFWSTTHPEFFEGKPYINRGVSGQTTSQMLSRFQADVVNLMPAVVVILGGTNDIAGNGGPTTVKKIQGNIASMAQLAKTNGIQVVLCSVLPVLSYSWKPEVKPVDSIISLNSLIKTYAQENEMIYADFYSALVNEQKGMKAGYSGDGVHPNLAGYKVMEPIVEEAIDKAFILARKNDITDQPGIITAQGENQPNELKNYAFDNDNTTKWLDLANANPATRSSWIQYQSSGSSYVVTQYTITSADDFPDRDPKSWNFLGSNNGSEWTTLDTRTNEVFSGRSQKKSYTFTNTAAFFSYYRLHINSVNNPTTATGVQLAEMEIFGTPVVTDITVFPTILNLEKNDLSQLKATITPTNASNNVTWSSSNEAVATVSSAGIVTAKAAGTATITVASANNNKTATCSVTVYKSDFSKSEAEDALLSGININNNHTGYSGSGFVAQFNAVGQYAQFSITDAAAGSQNIIIRYANANTQARALSLYVNGTKVGQISFPTTPNWATWADKICLVNLKEGNNTIKIQVDNGDTGQFNIDFIEYRVSDGSTGTFEISNNDISIYPNSDKTVLKLVNIKPNSTISVVSIDGKNISKVISKDSYVDFNVSNWAKGVYIFFVDSETNKVAMKAIVQ
jgi:lysophospholipase L1-like esterase/uncharacterized protein YjdB